MSSDYTLHRPEALAPGALDLTARGVHVARIGPRDAVELPLTTRYIDDVRDALRRRRPEPQWAQEPIWRPAEGGSEDPRFRWVAQTQRPEYREALQSWEDEVQAAVALAAIDLPFRDGSGREIPASDWAARFEVWREMGGTRSELARITLAVHHLHAMSMEDRERFLSGASEETPSPSGSAGPTEAATPSQKSSSRPTGSARRAGTPAPTSV